MGAQGWTIPVSQDDWMRDKEKRLNNQEARPDIKSASDLLGPGFAPMCVMTVDWSSDETAFNGMFYSQPGVENSPDSVKWWIGNVLGTADGYGLQMVREFRGSAQPRPEYIREFGPGAAGHTFGPWVLSGG